jgi:hypothetical protein
VTSAAILFDGNYVTLEQMPAEDDIRHFLIRGRDLRISRERLPNWLLGSIFHLSFPNLLGDLRHEGRNS